METLLEGKCLYLLYIIKASASVSGENQNFDSTFLSASGRGEAKIQPCYETVMRIYSEYESVPEKRI